MRGAVEVLVWWALLSGLWIVLISQPGTAETVTGVAAALAAALAAREAVRVVRR